MRPALQTIPFLFILALPLLLAFVPGDEIPRHYGPPWEIYENDRLYFQIEKVETANWTYAVIVNDTGRQLKNYFYYSFDGSAWEEARFDPAEERDAYLPISVELSLQVPEGTEVGYVTIFSCKEFDDGNGPEWKCGCRAPNDCNEPFGYWAIQEIEINESVGPGDPGSSGDEDCRYPDVSCPAEAPFCNIATGECDECMVADTSLCEEVEVCVEGTCTPVQCVTNADCVGVDAEGVRRSVCHPTKYECVACNVDADCIFLHNGTDLTGICDSLNTHLCSYTEHCVDKCMPDDVLNYGGVGKCEGNTRYACARAESGCFDHFPAEDCSDKGGCAMFGAVAYCRNNPHQCGRPCGCDGECNPYCGSGIDIFCPEVDPDCTGDCS